MNVLGFCFTMTVICCDVFYCDTVHCYPRQKELRYTGFVYGFKSNLLAVYPLYVHDDQCCLEYKHVQSVEYKHVQSDYVQLRLGAPFVPSLIDQPHVLPSNALPVNHNVLPHNTNFTF